MKYVSGKKRIFLLLFFLTLGAMQIAVLWWLPYTTSDIRFLEEPEAINSKPINGQFSVGELTWDLNQLSSDPALHPFREFFKKHCQNKQGLLAATCLSDILLRKVPFGEPSSEIFDPQYSPQAAFAAHMRGAPGHCVTYSGLSSLILLSSGTPARLAQILPKVKSGHNVIEVWDDSNGWVFFDPLNKTVFLKEGRPVSAADALRFKNMLVTAKADGSTGDVGYLNGFYEGELPFDGAIVYPEPWLYTRSGSQPLQWLHRGRFMAIGKRSPILGSVQRALRLGIILSTFSGLGCFIFLVRPGYRWSYRNARRIRNYLIPSLN